MAVSIYSSDGTLVVGSKVFLKKDLTEPAFDGIYSDGYKFCTVVNGIVTAKADCVAPTTTSTSTTTTSTTSTTTQSPSTTSTTTQAGTTTTTTLATWYGFNLSYSNVSCTEACGTTPATTLEPETTTTTTSSSTPTTTVAPSTTSTTTVSEATTTTTVPGEAVDYLVDVYLALDAATGDYILKAKLIPNLIAPTYQININNLAFDVYNSVTEANSNTVCSSLVNQSVVIYPNTTSTEIAVSKSNFGGCTLSESNWQSVKGTGSTGFVVQAPGHTGTVISTDYQQITLTNGDTLTFGNYYVKKPLGV